MFWKQHKCLYQGMDDTSPRLTSLEIWRRAHENNQDRDLRQVEKDIREIKKAIYMDTRNEWTIAVINGVPLGHPIGVVVRLILKHLGLKLHSHSEDFELVENQKEVENV